MVWALPQWESCSFGLEAFISLLQAGSLGEDLALQVCPFRVMVSTDWSAPRQHRGGGAQEGGDGL